MCQISMFVKCNDFFLHVTFSKIYKNPWKKGFDVHNIIQHTYTEHM
jgi:hypothetical protein